MMNKTLASAACLAAAVLSPSVAAQETQIMIGIPDDRFTRFNPNTIDGLNVSTAEIDALIVNKINTLNPLLSRFGLSARTSRFPANFTRDLLNEAFDELDMLRRDIETSFRTTIAQANGVRRVKSLSIGKGELGIRLTQANTSFTARVSGFRASARIELDSGIPIICPSPDVSVTIEDIAAQSTYNVFTGALMDTDIDFRVTDEDVDCNNFLGDALLAVFAIFTEVDGRIGDEIDDQVADITSMVDMQELFSIRDFIEGVRGAITATGGNFVNEAQVNMAIDAGLELFGSANLSTGLQLDLKLFDSNSPTTPNRFTLAASHQPARISSIAQNGPENVVFVVKPQRTARIELYQHGTQLIDTATRDYFRLNPAPQEGTILQVVAISSFIPGLRSFPSPYSRVFAAPGPSTCGMRQCRGRP